MTKIVFDPRIKWLDSSEHSADVAKWQTQRVLTGESEQARNQFALGITNLSDRQLRLNPFWDSLRGDPRSEKTVAVHGAECPRDMESSSAVPAERSMGGWGRSPAHW